MKGDLEKEKDSIELLRAAGLRHVQLRRIVWKGTERWCVVVKADADKLDEVRTIVAEIPLKKSVKVLIIEAGNW